MDGEMPVREYQPSVPSPEARAEIRKLLGLKAPPLASDSMGQVPEVQQFISKKDAANLLGVSERTVYRYVRRGALRSIARGRFRGVRRDDLNALRKCNAEPPPFPINRRTIARFHVEVRELRHHLKQCVELLNMKWVPLALSPDELVARHEAAARDAETGCAESSVGPWVDFLLRLRLPDLVAIEEQSQYAHPWLAFVQLSNGLQPPLEREGEKPHSEQLITAARANITVIAHAWILERLGQNALDTFARTTRTGVAGSSSAHAI